MRVGTAKGKCFVSSGTMFKNEQRIEVVHRVADEELGESIIIKYCLGTYEHFYGTSDIRGTNSKHYLATAYHCHFECEDPAILPTTSTEHLRSSTRRSILFRPSSVTSMLYNSQ
jgi:hypothetical protein